MDRVLDHESIQRGLGVHILDGRIDKIYSEFRLCKMEKLKSFTHWFFILRIKETEFMDLFEATVITDELYAAISQMVTQLTSNAPSPTREELLTWSSQVQRDLLSLDMNEKLSVY